MKKKPTTKAALASEPGTGKPDPPFLKVLSHDGKPCWEMSPGLLSAKADLEWKLKRVENITDNEMQRGLLAIEAMQHRVKKLVRNGEGLPALKDSEYLEDYLADNPPSKEEIMWMVGFLMPLAHHLTAPMPPCKPEEKWDQVWDSMPPTKEKAQEFKDNALKWVGKVIDWRFSDLLKDPQKEVIRANDLIPLALECCREMDGPPSRAELLSWLKTKGRKEFDLRNPNDLSVMWKLSGLAGLEKGKPGPDPSKKSRPGKYSKVPGVSYG